MCILITSAFFLKELHLWTAFFFFGVLCFNFFLAWTQRKKICIFDPNIDLFQDMNLDIFENKNANVNKNYIVASGPRTIFLNLASHQRISIQFFYFYIWSPLTTHLSSGINLPLGGLSHEGWGVGCCTSFESSFLCFWRMLWSQDFIQGFSRNLRLKVMVPWAQSLWGSL
jgi:hypothetical protein